MPRTSQTAVPAEARSSWVAEREASAQEGDGTRQYAASLTSQRVSDGLEGFLTGLQAVQEQHLLDLGPLSQDTVQVLGRPGRHLHFASLIQGFDGVRNRHPQAREEAGQRAASRLLGTYLDFPHGSIHGVLAWDVLQQLSEPALQSTLEFLAKIIRPNGIMFCLFHVGAKRVIPAYNFGVTSRRTFSFREVGQRAVERPFSTREIETLFHPFRAVHFYLKRDALLEVLVFS